MVWFVRCSHTASQQTWTHKSFFLTVLWRLVQFSNMNLLMPNVHINMDFFAFLVGKCQSNFGQ